MQDGSQHVQQRESSLGASLTVAPAVAAVPASSTTTTAAGELSEATASSLGIRTPLGFLKSITGRKTSSALPMPTLSKPALTASDSLSGLLSGQNTFAKPGSASSGPLAPSTSSATSPVAARARSTSITAASAQTERIYRADKSSTLALRSASGSTHAHPVLSSLPTPSLGPMQSAPSTPAAGASGTGSILSSPNGKVAFSPATTPGPKTPTMGMLVAASDEVAIGPYDAMPPAVLISDYQRHAGRLSGAARASELIRIAQSILVHDGLSDEEISYWHACSPSIIPSEPDDVRCAALQVLDACIVSSMSSLGHSTGAVDRAFYYLVMRDYDVPLENRTDRELDLLTDALSSLTRGGRDVSALTDVPDLVCEWAGEMFRRAQIARATLVSANVEDPLSPLTDPHLATPFVETSKLGPTAALRLLVTLHKMSFPRLTQASIDRACAFLMALCHITTSPADIEQGLAYVDTVNRYGYVPTRYRAEVVSLVARVVALDGRIAIASAPSTSLATKRKSLLSNATEIVVQPCSSLPSFDLPSRARQIISDLLRSPHNQTLRFLCDAISPNTPHSSILSTPAVSLTGCDDVLVAGAIASLRHAFSDFDASTQSQDIQNGHPRPTGGLPSLLGVGLQLVVANLVLVVERCGPVVLFEIVGLLRDCLFPSEGKAPASYDDADQALDLLESIIASCKVHYTRQHGADAASLSAVLAATHSLLAQMAAALKRGQFDGPLDKLKQCSISALSLPTTAGRSPFSRASAITELTSLNPASIRWLDLTQRLCQTLDIRHQADPEGQIAILRVCADTYSHLRETDDERSEYVSEVILPVIKAIDGVQLPSAAALVLMRLLIDAFCDSVKPSPDVKVDEAGNLLLPGSLLTVQVIQTWLVNLAVQPSPLSVRGELESEEAPQLSTTEQPMISACDMRYLCGSDAIDLAPCALITCFNRLLVSPTYNASQICRALFRDLVELLAPSPSAQPEDLPDTQGRGMQKELLASRRGRLVIAQWLVRLRADQNHRIFLRRMPRNAHYALPLLHRGFDDNKAEALPAIQTDSPLARRETRGRTARRDAVSPDRRERQSQTSGSDARAASRMRRSGRSTSRGREVAESQERLWLYPEELAFTTPEVLGGLGPDSLLSFDHDTAGLVPEDAERRNFSKRVSVLQVSLYLRAVVRLLKTESDFEILALVLSHLPVQLANKHLLCGPRVSVQLNALRKYLCESLTKDAFLEGVDLPSTVKRREIRALGFHSLSVLVAYKSIWSQAQRDELVLAFCNGLGGGKDVALPCIHALAVACHEMQIAVTKAMPKILELLSRIMSTTDMAVHILELIASIGLIPSLYANLTETDYRLVFAISLQYIATHMQSQRDAVPSPQHLDSLRDGLVNAFSQYVFHLAFYVIDLWFMSIRLSMRPLFVAFIVGRLYRANQDGPELDEASQVCMDMLARYAHHSADARLTRGSVPNADSLSQTWLIGNTLLTIDQLQQASTAEIILRRPSGNLSLTVHVPTRDNTAEALLPAFLMLQISGSPSVDQSTPPLGVPKHDRFKRALSVLDSIPVVDFHKVGVVYVAPRQTREAEILQNVRGSKSYHRFLSELGDLIHLKDRGDAYVGGLDVEHDIDGQYAYAWGNSGTQIAYHVTTMMPTDRERDPQCTLKKRHVGNDFVKIIFNESGEPYSFDTIDGQFNLINVVIVPHTPQGVPWRRPGMSSNAEYFKVSIQRREDMPDFGPLGQYKMVSADALAQFVRHLSLHADMFAQIFLETHGVPGSGATHKIEYVSNWRHRLQNIKQIRQRVVEHLAGESTPADASSGYDFTRWTEVQE
ncbi:uncharacterized protein L969DRAFT_87857 [Mixia osmundae IAM 14324]|nr:uncharacterized protein L969DRAFT_87857 [Mixia osmundae IAM 14324]KEI38644.1 hypothetical protein L969DRAFT_87857 [Mixia osmundae IAM 14324]